MDAGKDGVLLRRRDSVDRVIVRAYGRHLGRSRTRTGSRYSERIGERGSDEERLVARCPTTASAGRRARGDGQLTSGATSFRTCRPCGERTPAPGPRRPRARLAPARRVPRAGRGRVGAASGGRLPHLATRAPREAVHSSWAMLGARSLERRVGVGDLPAAATARFFERIRHLDRAARRILADIKAPRTHQRQGSPLFCGAPQTAQDSTAGAPRRPIARASSPLRDRRLRDAWFSASTDDKYGLSRTRTARLSSLTPFDGGLRLVTTPRPSRR